MATPTLSSPPTLVPALGRCPALGAVSLLLQLFQCTLVTVTSFWHSLPMTTTRRPRRHSTCPGERSARWRPTSPALEPERLTTAQATELFGLFARADPARLGRAGPPDPSGGAVRRLEERGPPLGRVVGGARRPGPGLGDAMATLETARAPRSRCPETTEALRNGRAVGAPGTRDRRRRRGAARRRSSGCSRPPPPARSRASRTSVDSVRAAAARRRPRTRATRRSRRSRFFRHWSDPDGAFRGEFKLTPDAGARMLSSPRGAAPTSCSTRRGRPDRREPPVALRRRRVWSIS